jgi:hypothetical protein
VRGIAFQGAVNGCQLSSCESSQLRGSAGVGSSGLAPSPKRFKAMAAAFIGPVYSLELQRCAGAM